IITLALVQGYGMFNYIYITVGLFLAEFFLKTIVGPHASPISVISRLIIRKQEPEYVGAIQKKFAWALGLIMAITMLTVLLIGVRGAVPLTICFICLGLMWIESSFGICVGCKIYWFLVNKKIIKEPKHRPKCSGNSCSL
ncbi:DUF4395 domain-containing protein, partial [Candidatus Woesearchaeota archaeon]|nr:DUF4395 domain-containing protein [Candidatus Woesearchaeota archaeon]